MPRRIDVQLHKMHMTNLVETPDIPGLVAQTQGFQLSQELLVVVTRICLQRGFRIYRHSVGPTAKEFRLLLMCGHY